MEFNIIETKIKKLRDPFVLVEDGTYYMYGTGWICYKNSGDLRHWIKSEKELVVIPSECCGDEWAKNGVTDGCFMYKTKDNQLLMLWSNFNKDGYCVAIARSKNGKVDGEWVHDEKLLFSKETFGQYDGGHGMIFTDVDGQMYLSIHSPNAPVGDRMEKPVIIPVFEECGTIVI